MLKKLFFISCLVILIQACSNISLLNTRKFYSEEFLKKVESIQLIYKDGDKRLALKKLKSIPNENLNKDELAKKYNLLGVMYFKNGDIELAIEKFQFAKGKVDQDVFLLNQIKLNLASAYFKKNQHKLAYEELKRIDDEYLQEKDRETFYKLSFTVANQIGDSKRVVNALLKMTKEIISFSQVEDFTYKEILVDNFKSLSESERVYFLDEQAKENPYVISYLGRLEAIERLYKGDRKGAEDVVSWLKRKFIHLKEINSFVADFEFRVDNYAKINPRSIGLNVSLSGKTKRWGQQALAGVNTALSKLTKNEDLFKIFVKNNKNNPFLARQRVQELVEKHNVSVIIGGLFPALAKEEYLEARKYGVLFISLSPVYLPRSEKNHLLIEVSGSVESQISSLINNELVKSFGNRMSILYPDSDEGYSYLNEFWSLNNLNKVELVNSNKYERGIKDYRAPVKELLGLKYPRERKEEYLVWKDIKNIERANVRIINVLPPVIDFDWVFVPSLPSEALQILPTFSYFDAKSVKFVGGPSWINNTLKNNKSSLGEMYVIGNDLKGVSAEFTRMYREVNKRNPHLVDTLSYDSMVVALKLLQGQKFSSRNEFENLITSSEKLEGVTSAWKLESGLWLKQMDLLKVARDGFKRVEMDAE